MQFSKDGKLACLYEAGKIITLVPVELMHVLIRDLWEHLAKLRFTHVL